MQTQSMSLDKLTNRCGAAYGPRTTFGGNSPSELLRRCLVPSVSVRRQQRPGGHNITRPWPAVKTAAMGKKPGLISTLITEHLSEAAGFSPKVQFLITHGVGSFLVPLMYGWAITTAMHYLAQQARAWCEENQDKEPSTEVIGMLPAALEGPTVITVYIMIAVRLVRNAAWCLDSYVHAFDAKWNRSVDALVEAICGYLIPIDQALVKVYSLVMVAFITVVLVKWKTIALEYFLLKRQSQLAAAEAARSSNSRIKAIKAAAASTEDLERLLVPLDAVSSWLAYAAAVLVCAQVLGFDIAPLLAVGGASSIMIGLATQQLLTNAVMGLSLFLTRPFVAGDNVTCQGSGGMVMSGVVEHVSPMRTTLRSDDDILVSIPNRTVADMVVYNRSATMSSSRLAKANRKTEPLKLRIKVPHAATSQLGELQAAVMEVLGSSTAAAAVQAASSGSDSNDERQPATVDLAAGGGGRSSSSVSSSLLLSGESWSGGSDGAALVAPGSIEVQLTKFTDAGLELLVKSQLRADRSSPAVQLMLLNLNNRVRQTGAVLVNL